MRAPSALLAKLLLVSLLALSVAGCAVAQLQLRTSPAVATLTELGTGRKFQTPVDISYVLTEKQRDSSGCYVVQGFVASWPSGAAAKTYDRIQLCGQGPIWNYKLDRPAGYPNLALDQRAEAQFVATQQRNAEIMRAAISGFASGYFGGSSSSTYVPPPITDIGRTGPTDTVARDVGPQLAPNGSYVSGTGPMTLCPNGQYVAGNCVLTPNGTYVGGQ